jgi:hypothetical protein
MKRKLAVFMVATALTLAALTADSYAAAFFRSFDGPSLIWQPLDARPEARVVSHACDGDDAREGSRSERLAISAPGGEAMHFLCSVGRIPVLDELESRLWVKANRPGVILAARVVLPRSRDAKTGAAKTTLVQGEQNNSAGRWQQLRLADVPRLLADQVRVLRATRGSNIDAREAYIDAIVLILPGGPDNTVTWTDALEVEGVVLPAVAKSPNSNHDDQVSLAVFASPGLPTATTTAPQAPLPSTAPQARFQGTTWMVGDRPFLLRAIEWNHEPFAYLAARGFNTILLDEPPTPDQSAEAARSGLWLICVPPSPEALASTGIGPGTERVLAWHLGSPTGPQELEQSRRWAELVRSHDPVVSRPIFVAPRGDWLPASRVADVLVADHPAAATLAEADFAEWLAALPRLARPGTPLFAHIPTQPAARTRNQIAALSPNMPTAPTMLDDAQLDSLLTAALTHSYRGFVFGSDSPLNAADAVSQRRALLLELHNNRLDMLGPWLTIGSRIGDATSTDGTAKGIVLQAERARLLVPLAWGTAPEPVASKTTSTVPLKTVAFIVPGVPESNNAYLLSPVGLQSLESKRVAGGMRVTVDRNASGWILMTEDPTVITAFRQRIARGAGRAAQLQFSLATGRIRSLATFAAQAQRVGINTKQVDQAMGSANSELRGVNAMLAARNFEPAYKQSAAADELLSKATQQTRAQFAASPTFNSIPFAADAGSLARFAGLDRSLASLRGSENQLLGGDFESLDELKRVGWQHIEDPISGIQTKVQLASRGPHEGHYCLELSAQAVPATSVPQIVARPVVWITSPPIRATAGEVVEISGWVRVTEPIVGSIEGLQIVDSLGGQELAIRVRQTSDWQPFRMIRSSDETTEMTLTFALAGVGSAQVDGVMVRSLSAPTVKRLPTVPTQTSPTQFSPMQISPVPPAPAQPGPAFPNSARRTLFPAPIQR